MRARRQNIHIVFRQILPEQVVQGIVSSKLQSDNIPEYKYIPKEIFLNISGWSGSGYSIDEREEQYKLLCSDMSKGYGNIETKPSVFNIIYGFSESVLRTERFVPVCKYSELLKWQDTSHYLGQDLFTTAFLAYNDFYHNTVTNNFAWDPIIKNTNNRLNKLLNEGLAENHYHLNGSSQCFPLNWVSIMNNPDLVGQVAYEFETNLQNSFTFGTNYNTVSWKVKLFWAECIRLYLFKKNRNALGKDDFTVLINNLKLNTSNEIDVKIDELKSKLATAKNTYGLKLPYDKICFDYAILNTIARDGIKYNRILVGERQFMYDCYKNCLNGEFSEEEKNLFYAYLLIKSIFRGEIIQINNDIGFRNFKNYQDRKFVPKKIPDYKNEVIRLALNSTLHSQPIISLEARVMPKKKPKNIFKYITGIDTIYDDCEKADDPLVYPMRDNLFLSRRNKKYFFVFHYPKGKFQLEECSVEPMPRNYYVRKNNRDYTKALINALESNEYLRDAIKGIDACANEIGCRPEVFATDFRALRQVVPQKKASIYGTQEIPAQLSVTYHVGEDFLNITDGLRAIDEAIQFLRLRHNDRIGHALALGINVDDYYKYKNYRIIMPKQDILDDAVWILFRANELNITVETGLERRLLSLIQEYISYIYGAFLKKQKVRWDAYTYYCSWKLRGDYPKCYKSGCFEELQDIEPVYYTFEKNPMKDIENFREDQDISKLYFAYHYDFDSKKRGLEADVFKITPDYIKLVKTIQEKFRYIIAEKGIMIECNPTSNYLIGTIDRYDSHPITVFNNLGLEFREEKIADCAQICVSINTDDQGIFDTSLVNEYAIVCASLDKKKDENGNKVYSPEHIYQYIENIRKMGIYQSFNNDMSKWH